MDPNTVISAELVAEARKGKRITTEHSRFEQALTIPCAHTDGYRVIACDGTRDVGECSICGRQTILLCNFDSEGN